MNGKVGGTQLKPSFEPIIVARKPVEGTIVNNVMKYGVGGINIDECRVGNEERTIPIHSNDKKEDNKMFNLNPTIQHERIKTSQGRFPANTILTYDDTDFDEVCGEFPNTKGNGNIRKNKNNGKGYNCYSNYGDCETKGYEDSGSASRYFYCAKASKKDREEGLNEFEYKIGGSMIGTQKQTLLSGNGNIRNNLRKNIHPAVKPTELIQYLVRLVSPKGAIILDPFMGSGSTGKAVVFENKERNANYNFIGIEQNEEYCKIAEARINWANIYKEENNQIKINDL